MTTEQIKQIAKVKFETINTQELIDTVVKYSNDFNEGVEIAIEVIMDILMVRMTENEYIQFCESL